MTDAELLAQLDAAIAAHAGVNVVQEDGKRVEYTDLADLISHRNAVSARIEASAGTFRRRTLSKNGGIG